MIDLVHLYDLNDLYDFMYDFNDSFETYNVFMF